MLKNPKFIVGILLAFLISGAIFFSIFKKRYDKMASTIKNEYAAIGKVDLKKIPDGTYNGKFGDFLVSVDLDVEVKNHKIEKITVRKQGCGRGYEALETIDRIIKAQAPKVDAVSGATGSSMTIMIAVNRALTTGK